jgi:hypothetical protein
MLGGPSHEEKAMNIGKISATIALATGLGMAAAAFAEESSQRSGPDDETGLTTLGIDITGGTGVEQDPSIFLTGLSPDTQQMVINGCQTAIDNPVGYHYRVLGFCGELIATGSGAFVETALGFVPQAPAPTFAPDQAPTQDPFADLPYEG